MKTFFFTICAGISAVFFFSGCSNIRELNSSMNEAAAVGEISEYGLRIVRNKTTRSEVFNSIGAPSLIFKNEKGGESWVYSRVALRKSDLEFTASGNFAVIFPYDTTNINKGGGIAGVKAGSGLSTSKSTYKTAGLLIQFNRKGCVSSYEFTATSF